MKDRRKDSRKASKEISFKANNISKIIFVKKLIIPTIAFFLGLIYFLFVSISAYIDTQKIQTNKDNYKKKILLTKNKIKQRKKDIQKLQISLAKDMKQYIDEREVRPLASKLIDFLTTTNLISTATFNLKRDEEYKNVLHIMITASYNTKFLNQEILKKLFYALFKKVFYIKDITVHPNTISIQIYKKV